MSRRTSVTRTSRCLGMDGIFDKVVLYWLHEQRDKMINIKIKIIRTSMNFNGFIINFSFLQKKCTKHFVAFILKILTIKINFLNK